MTLLDAKIGSVYEIEQIQLEAAVQRRMEMLGMTHHTKIQVLNRKRNGSVIFKVRGTRYAIGRRFAQGIYVGGADNA